MSKIAVIFDFDGTIADTRDAFMGILNRLSGEFGYQPASPEEVVQLRNLSSQEIIKHSRIPGYKIPFLLRRAKTELNKEIITVSPFLNMEETLCKLHQYGCELGIVTSNHQSNVLAFLKQHDWQDLFSFVYSGVTIFGKDRIIKRTIRQRKLSTSRVFYVGDETRDIQAARKSGVTMIAVSWGFNSPEVLSNHHPDFLIDHPSKLLEILTEM